MSLRRPRRSPTYAEFFAGIGLVTEALQPLGWECRFANDIEPTKQVIYGANHGLDYFVLGDVADLKGEDVPDVDLAWASFPCVDLSLAGWGKGLDGTDSRTFWPFTRIIEDMPRRPPVVVLENVLGFATSNGGDDFAKAVGRMNELGYVADILVIDAVHFVPQSRPRLFVVCIEESRIAGDETWSSSAARPAWIHRIAEANPQLALRSMELPPLPDRRADLEKFLQRLPESAPEWWPEKRFKHLLSQMNPAHRARANSLSKGRKWRFATVYKRVRDGATRAEVRVDGVAGCLRTPRGGSSRQIVLAGRNGELRARHMTPREYARLMGAPDGFRIDVPVNQALWGFGDAVCVPVVAWLAENYLKTVV